jgi:hypothetical protein
MLLHMTTNQQSLADMRTCAVCRLAKCVRLCNCKYTEPAYSRHVGDCSHFRTPSPYGRLASLGALLPVFFESNSLIWQYLAEQAAPHERALRNDSNLSSVPLRKAAGDTQCQLNSSSSPVVRVWPSRGAAIRVRTKLCSAGPLVRALPLSRMQARSKVQSSARLGILFTVRPTPENVTEATRQSDYKSDPATATLHRAVLARKAKAEAGCLERTISGYQAGAFGDSGSPTAPHRKSGNDNAFGYNFHVRFSRQAALSFVPQVEHPTDTAHQNRTRCDGIGAFTFVVKPPASLQRSVVQSGNLTKGPLCPTDAGVQRCPTYSLRNVNSRHSVISRPQWAKTAQLRGSSNETSNLHFCSRSHISGWCMYETRRSIQPRRYFAIGSTDVQDVGQVTRPRFPAHHNRHIVLTAPHQQGGLSRFPIQILSSPIQKDIPCSTRS